MTELHKAVNVWNVYEQHVHLTSYNVANILYHRYLTLLRHYGSYFPEFAALSSAQEQAVKDRDDQSPQNRLYITSRQFINMTWHLKSGNQILPGKERPTRDFKRQMLVWDRMEQAYEEQAVSGDMGSVFNDGTGHLMYSVVKNIVPGRLS